MADVDGKYADATPVNAETYSPAAGTPIEMPRPVWSFGVLRDDAAAYVVAAPGASASRGGGYEPGGGNGVR